MEASAYEKCMDNPFIRLNHANFSVADSSNERQALFFCIFNLPLQGAILRDFISVCRHNTTQRCNYAALYLQRRGFGCYQAL